MRRVARLLAVAGSGVFLASLMAQQADIVIAPSGDDQAGRGTPEAPYATLARARDAIRDLRQREPARAAAVRVLLRGGTYFLESPFRQALARV